MRIVILTNADVGLYRFRKELIEELCKSNEVYIVLPNGDFIEQLKSLGCKFIPFEFNRRGTNPIADIGQLKGYIQILKSLKPDIVLTYTIKPNVYGGMACEITNVPYISNVTGLGTAIENGGLMSLISTTLYRIGLKKADCVFFQNINNQKLFIEKGIVKERTRLIPGSGVNLQMNNQELYPDDEHGIRFLFVGRIMKDKGIEELLHATEEIIRKRSDIIVDVVGACDEDYMEQLNKAEKDGFIRYHGMQSDVHPFYKACHCTVLPSYHEGMANVLLESSATGRPVITTRVPGCKETFDEGITGFGCEARDVVGLKIAMEKFIELSNDKRSEMGQAARAKMEREYDRRIVIDAYKEEIQKLQYS